MNYRKVNAKSTTRVEYSFGRHTILTKSEFSTPLENVTLQYYDPNLGNTVQVEMTRDDLGDLLALLTKMQLCNEIHIPTDYVTN